MISLSLRPLPPLPFFLMFPLNVPCYEMTVPIPVMYCTNLFNTQRITYFLKNSLTQIGRRLLANTDVPPCPPALLGSRAHKLDKESNFPVGLLQAPSAHRHTVSFQGRLISILLDVNGLIRGQLELDCGLVAC